MLGAEALTRQETVQAGVVAAAAVCGFAVERDPQEITVPVEGYTVHVYRSCALALLPVAGGAVHADSHCWYHLICL